MKKEKKQRFWTPINIVLFLSFFSLSAYFYAGFFFPDKTIFPLLPKSFTIYIAILLFFPAAVAGLFFLYRSAYLKRIKASSALITLLLCSLGVLLLYPAAAFRYNRQTESQISNFHSFLQLKPNDIPTIDGTKYNIFCLGGSTTEFKDEKGRDWPSLVEKKLMTTPGFETARMINCGKQWYSTLHILIHYTQNVRPLKPDAIIVMENINDLLHNADHSRLSKGIFRNDYGHFLGPLTRIVEYGNFSSYITKSFSAFWYQEKPKDFERSEFPGLDSFERNLKTIITLARNDGTRIILMTQPNIYKEKMSQKELEMLIMLNIESVGSGKKWSYKTAYRGINAYNDRIRKVASDENVILIDLDKAVPKTSEYFYDDVHYKPKAYDRISDFLAIEIPKKIYL